MSHRSPNVMAPITGVSGSLRLIAVVAVALVAALAMAIPVGGIGIDTFLHWLRIVGSIAGIAVLATLMVAVLIHR